MKLLKLLSWYLLALVAVLFLSIFTACKKYEEGPGLSLRSKSARLANTWQVEIYIKNDVDKTEEEYKNSAYAVEISKDGDITETLTNKDNGVVFYTRAGKWTFKNDEEQVEAMYGNEITTYDILRLKEEELWITKTETSFGSTTKHEWHMVPKD